PPTSPLSLHDALPIFDLLHLVHAGRAAHRGRLLVRHHGARALPAHRLGGVGRRDAAEASAVDLVREHETDQETEYDPGDAERDVDRKSTRLNSSHDQI